MTTRTDFEFDSVFTVDADGSVTERPDLYAPDVYHDDELDIVIQSYGPRDWDALTGYTGQYSYNGATMHASEQFAGNLAHDVLSTPGTYVLVVVNVLPEEGDEDPEPAGWAVLRMAELA